MTDAQDLKSTVKVCMFDQYGTVVDMQTGLVDAATPFLRAKGWQGNPNSFVTWWRRAHFENSMIDALLHKEHTPYREIGERSVAYVMDRAGIRYTMDEVHALVDHIVRLRPFPEVPAALDRLRTCYRLVVLSNGDPDMLEDARQYHGVAFERMISVAEANSFKPHVATYTKAAEDCRRTDGRSAVHRQPCIRLYRRKGGRNEHGVHRPPSASVRRNATPAGPAGAKHDRLADTDRLTLYRMNLARSSQSAVLLPQPRLQHLAGRGMRQLIDEHHIVGQPPLGDLVRQELHQLLLGHIRAVLAMHQQ